MKIPEIEADPDEAEADAATSLVGAETGAAIGEAGGGRSIGCTGCIGWAGCVGGVCLGRAGIAGGGPGYCEPLGEVGARVTLEVAGAAVSSGGGPGYEGLGEAGGGATVGVAGTSDCRAALGTLVG